MRNRFADAAFYGRHTVTVRPGRVQNAGLTVHEVARWLQVEPRSVYRMIADGRLRPSLSVPLDEGGKGQHLFTFDEVLRAESNLIRHTRRGVTV